MGRNEKVYRVLGESDENRMGEDRLLKQVMMQVMELGDGVQWRQDLEKSLRMFGWEGLLAEGLNSLSMSEVRQMLRDVAWREAMDSWKEEARSHSKLAEVQKLIEKGYEAWCVEVKCKWRRVLVQWRALEVETGRWRGVSREGRMCRNCRSEEVENVEHWLLRCTGMAEEREKLIMTMREKVEWQSMRDDERVAAVLSYACRDDGVGRGVKMWRKRFFDRSLTVPVPPSPSSADP